MKTRLETMRFTQHAFNKIINTVGKRPAESGGIVVGSREDFVITDFLYDENGKSTATTYSPDIKFINPMLTKLYEEQGLQLLGFLHSHPMGVKNLSGPDKAYFKGEFDNIPVEQFLTPIVFALPDGKFDMHAHIFYRDTMTSEEVPWEVIPNDYQNREHYSARLPEFENEHFGVSLDDVLSQNNWGLKFYGTIDFDKLFNYSGKVLTVGNNLTLFILQCLAILFLFKLISLF